MKRPDGIAVRPFHMLFEGAGGNHSPRRVQGGALPAGGISP